MEDDFKHILDQNKLIDSEFMDMIKCVGKDVISDRDKIEFQTHIYKRALEFIIEQNKQLSEASKIIKLPKSGKKLQTYLEKTSSKYMDALTKTIR